jgi:hemerythrin-like domain-containing protein
VPTTAIDVLTDEHEQLVQLFERVSSPDEDRRKVLADLMQHLATHVAGEKQLLIPVLHDAVAGSTNMCDDLKGMHDRVEHLLTLLARRKFNSPDVPDMVNELLDLTDNHIAQAKTTIFPALREALSAQELDQLGARLTSDERHMLTHAHPVVPDAGPVAEVMRKGAELVDKVRDRSTGLGRSSE